MSAIPTRDFVLEVGTEEIPAGMTAKAAEELSGLIVKGLAAARLAPSKVQCFATPRRLAVCARGIPERQEDRTVEKRGPAVKLGLDTDGHPTKAGLGFARGQGLEFSQLITLNMDGVDYLFARKEQPGQPALALLPEILAGALGAVRFPKSMRWGAVKQPFVRPIHWLLALFGREVVPFSFADVTSANVTFGHRFMGPRGPLAVNDADAYQDVLRKAFVLVCPEERRRRIEEESDRIERELGLTLVRDPDLLGTVVHLAEYPVAASGVFHEKFLQMPSEVLVTSMKNHQKFFAFKKDGKLSNRFLVINNTVPRDLDVVVRGNQRVLAARLEDALFFFREDVKTPLAQHADRLADQMFLAGLGTMKDKTDRLAGLAQRYAALLFPAAAAVSPIAVRAAQLCKADLSTQLVGEFPELQGVMGREYAAASGEPPEVAAAIFEHYLPRGALDELPRTEAGMVLALADRMDTMVGCFHLGLIPTASKDPYALRRAALACVRILVERSLTASLSALVRAALDNYGALVTGTRAKIEADLLEFIQGRLRHWLSADHATELVDACLAAGADSPYEVCEKVRAIEPLRGRKDYEDLILPFKRVINITRSQATGDHAFNPGLAQHATETALWNAFLAARDRIAALLAQRRFPEALALLLELKPPVDRYFDDVLVMCDDPVERDNHLAMLAEIGRLFLGFADFTRILA